jgi:hypothetical protein
MHSRCANGTWSACLGSCRLLITESSGEPRVSESVWPESNSKKLIESSLPSSRQAVLRQQRSSKRYASTPMLALDA